METIMAHEYVVLVDKNDRKIGLMEKLAAHRGSGEMHRAVSVLLYRKKNGMTEVLLQQRSKNKLLWSLFWSNTVCTHPRDGEAPVDCAVRRLQEEMEIFMRSADIQFLFTLLYQACYNDELSEHELDYVFVGEWDGEYQINTDESNDAKWMAWEEVKKDVHDNSQNYTPWFTDMLRDNRLSQIYGG